MPRRDHQYGAVTRSRTRAFLVPVGVLVLLSAWWCMAGSAGAASYPPRPGCAVSGVAVAGAGQVQVRGTGFGAGARVLVRLAGRSSGVTADAAGSFQASWRIHALAAGATVTAADAGCSAAGTLVDEPTGSGAPGGTGPRTLPPSQRGDPEATAIPSIPVTGLPPQLFLGLAGALLLAGAGLTGLTGRLGHRGEVRPASDTSVARTLPRTPDPA